MRELAAIRAQLAALAACRCRGECPIIADATTDRPSSAKPRRTRK
jgi:hypothetical protein